MATSSFEATVTADGIKGHFYVEIEGIRVRYGDHNPSWGPADSGTNRPIKEYFTKLPEITGQVAEPLNGSTTPHEFTVEILDVDEEITSLFSAADTTNYNSSTLAEDLDSSETGVDVADGTQFSAGDDIYIDRETMRVTSVAANTLTVTRGMYGSEATAHERTDDQNNTRTVMVYTNPPFMLTREVVLCEGRTDLLEADVIKFRGYLDDIEEANGVYRLHCSGYLRRLNCMIGQTLAKTKLGIDLWGEQVSTNTSNNPAEPEPTSSWGIYVPVADYFQSSGHVIIDNEIIKYESTGAGGTGGHGYDALWINSDTTFNPMTINHAAANRGLFASEILGPEATKILRALDDTSGVWKEYTVSIWCKGHSRGAEVREIIHSQKFKDGLSLTDTEALTASDVILSLLLSKDGDGNNHATYDILPTGWGAGITASKIDTTGIENICAHPSVSAVDFHPFAITEATDCKDWLEENILRPCHLFFVETDEGKISVRRLYSKNEAVELMTATALTENDIFDIPRFSPGKAPLGQFSINMNWHPGEDEFYGKVNVLLADARTKYMGTARSFEIDCKTIYDWRIGSGQGNWVSSASADLPDALAGYLGVIWSNFAIVPCPIVEFSVSYAKFIDVQVGQIITLTSTQTPNLKASARSISGEYFQIIEAHPNPERSSVDCVAWMIGIYTANTRLLAPAAKISAWDGGTNKVTLVNSEFADGDKYTYDVDAFSAGDKVMLVDAAYDGLSGGAPEVMTIDSTTTGAGTCTITFTGAPTDAPGADDYVVTAPYDSCVAAQKAKWAYLADTTPTLGAAGDSAHKYER